MYERPENPEFPCSRIPITWYDVIQPA